MNPPVKAYLGNLGNGQTVYLQNQSDQTLITLANAAAGQQQSQTNSFTTGEWTLPPTLFRAIASFVLRIETHSGQTWIQIQSSQVKGLAIAPPLIEAEVISLQPLGDRPLQDHSFPAFQPQPPLTPMQPLRMGNMEMQMQPMQMRMGNMEMRMSGEDTSPTASAAFCSQCGTAVKPEDRFCAHCGHRLKSA